MGVQISHSDLAEIEELLRRGADPNTLDENGDTMLMKVCRQLFVHEGDAAEPYRALAMLLIEYGARVDAMSAVLLGDIELLDIP